MNNKNPKKRYVLLWLHLTPCYIRRLAALSKGKVKALALTSLRLKGAAGCGLGAGAGWGIWGSLGRRAGLGSFLLISQRFFIPAVEGTGDSITDFGQKLQDFHLAGFRVGS